MKWVLISDVHGNIEALDAVLADIDERFKAPRIVCAGDLVGYGPDPEACIDRLRQRNVACVMGNHDEMVIGRRDFSRCVYAGIKAARWTRRTLSAAAMAYLRQLPGNRTISDTLTVCHGDLHDADFYVTNEAGAERALRQLEDDSPQSKILVCGHTHHASIYSKSRGFQRVSGSMELTLSTDERCLLNPGAVGQSRDGKPLARYAILDEEAGMVAFHELSYDHELTLEKLRRAGLVSQVVMLRPTGINRYIQAVKVRAARVWAGLVP